MQARQRADGHKGSDFVRVPGVEELKWVGVRESFCSFTLDRQPIEIRFPDGVRPLVHWWSFHSHSGRRSEGLDDHFRHARVHFASWMTVGGSKGTFRSEQIGCFGKSDLEISTRFSRMEKTSQEEEEESMVWSQ